MDCNFGKYTIPPTLQTLIDLEKELGGCERFYDGLHFYLSLSNLRYFNTPSDVIVFGNLGVDGIHYGFLTDYGSVSTLEEAPIVCVCPMDFDHPIRLIAKNLREFLRIHWTDEPLLYNDFTDKAHYLAWKEQWAVDYALDTQQLLLRARIESFLEDNVEMPVIAQPYHSIQHLRLERQKRVSIQTQDGLGATMPLLTHETHVPFPLHKDREMDLEAVAAYISRAAIPSRYALFRDIQLHYILADEPQLKSLVLESMLAIGLIDEAKRLAEMD